MIRQELNPATCKLDEKQINLRRKKWCRYKWLIRPLIHRNAIASLDWIGKSAPVPLHYLKKGEEGRKKKEVLHLSRCYTHTEPHVPLLQRFNYFGRSLGDWLWVTPISALTSSCLSPLRMRFTGWGRVLVCLWILHWLDSYCWTDSFHRLSSFDITNTDTCTIAAAV